MNDESYLEIEFTCGVSGTLAEIGLDFAETRVRFKTAQDVIDYMRNESNNSRETLARDWDLIDDFSSTIRVHFSPGKDSLEEEDDRAPGADQLTLDNGIFNPNFTNAEWSVWTDRGK